MILRYLELIRFSLRQIAEYLQTLHAQSRRDWLIGVGGWVVRRTSCVVRRASCVRAHAYSRRLLLV